MDDEIAAQIAASGVDVLIGGGWSYFVPRGVAGGRRRDERNLLETLRELAALDGAFLVDKRGVVARAAAYLDAPVSKKVQVRRGLGARHVAAAAITAKTDSEVPIVSYAAAYPVALILMTVFAQTLVSLLG